MLKPSNNSKEEALDENNAPKSKQNRRKEKERKPNKNKKKTKLESSQDEEEKLGLFSQEAVDSTTLENRMRGA